MGRAQSGLEETTCGRINGADAQLMLPPATIRPALAELLKAFDYAASVASDPWSFAVEIASLRALGLFESDFRWLVSMGYAQHAREVTLLEDDGREFRPTGMLSFCERTCFVLTEAGAAFARRLLASEAPMHADAAAALAASKPHVAPAATNFLAQELLPIWDYERHELWYAGRLVKRFRWPAINQETILAVFDEEGWPTRIDDPLSPQPKQNPKRRLHDTIKCLNRKQANRLIHFRGDGTGEGVLWEIIVK